MSASNIAYIKWRLGDGESDPTDAYGFAAGWNAAIASKEPRHRDDAGHDWPPMDRLGDYYKSTGLPCHRDDTHEQEEEDA